MPLSTGTRLGPYEILAPLGAGGMGEVYRARDTRLHRDVAIKVLPEAAAMNPEARARFSREALATASLAHPNLLALFDVGTEQGITYAVMELLEGSTLREKTAGGPVPVDKVIEIADQMARGLASMHDRGIVHRDLKPENVFVTRDGHVKILDFGLARFMPSGQIGEESATVTGVTTPGTIMGTMGYMAPEQLMGERVDARADLFCFGAIVYELLTGRRAFPGSSWAEATAAILKGEPPALRDSVAGIPPALDEIVRTCLKKEPESRYASAGEILEVLHGTTPPAPPSTAGPARTRPWAWMFVLLPLLALLAFLAVSRRGKEPGSPPPEQGSPKSIAMLPFENLTGDAEFDWIGQGLPELLGTALSRSRELDVYDPQRLVSILASPDPAGESAPPTFEKLKGHGIARAVVGSILRSSENISIQFRVVDVGTGRVLHADAMTGPASSDLFRLAGDLIQKLQTWLEIDVVAAGTEDEWLRDITTSSSDAYRLFLRAREALIGFRWREAADYAEQSVAIDSQFVAAYVDLVGSYWNLGEQDLMRTNLDRLRRLRPAASPRDVIQIDIIDAVVTGDPDQLIRAASSAHELYPGDRHFTYLLGRGYYTAGRFEQCIEVLDPLIAERYAWAWTYVLAGRSHLKLGHIEDARRCLATGMEVTGRNPEVALEYARFLREVGDSTLARSVLLEAGRSPLLAETPAAEVLIRLKTGRIYEAEGKPDSARSEYERVLVLLGPDASARTDSSDDERMREALDGLDRLGRER